MAFEVLKKIIVPLIITILLETIISFVLGIRKKANYKKILFINLISNPIFNIINIFTNFKISVYLSAFIGINMYIASSVQIYVLEFLIIVFEALYYNKYMEYEAKFLLNIINNNKYKYLVYSLLLNSTSYLGGAAIHKCLNI